MRILIVGAGAIGGYFGGRLMEKGEDVTFLVRKKRKKLLEQSGLQINSVHGDIEVTPTLIMSSEVSEPFDVILLSTKSYQLDGAIRDITPYVGESTMILPLLNGISHITKLVEAFGEKSVIGGLCFIETTLNTDGAIVQSSPIHDLIFGERDGQVTDRIRKLEASFKGTKATFRLSDNIDQDMWHKYSFITALSGVTSLFRSPIGPIREQETGYKTTEALLSEISTVMKALNAPIKSNLPELQLDKIMQMGHSMKSSMQRDMEKSFSTEADHLQGFLLEKALNHHIDTPVLQAVYANLKVYEAGLV